MEGSLPGLVMTVGEVQIRWDGRQSVREGKCWNSDELTFEQSMTSEITQRYHSSTTHRIHVLHKTHFYIT